MRPLFFWAPDRAGSPPDRHCYSQAMKWPPLPGGCLLLAACLAGTGTALAGDAPSPGAWNATTPRRAAEPAPAPDQTLDLRLYEPGAFDHRLPYRPPARDRDRAFAVDVQAVMTRCADGRQLITALVIGGVVTPLDARCPDTARPATPAPQCDANRWNCGTAAPP